ncbi:MAG: hypothetical protein KBT11_06940 [Treponema sp.]|nr:hypothetical protein [Candidatus Treponema equifaecale]
MKLSKKTSLLFASLLLGNLSFSQPNEGVVSVRDVVETVTTQTISENVPPLLQGIWQGSDRLVMFSNENEFALVLRVFYQWYNDRAAEPASFRQLKTRDRNNTTITPSEEIEVKFKTIVENPSKTAGVYELCVKYPYFKENVFIPVCVINGNLYLDFLIKDSAQITDFGRQRTAENANESREGFYRSASSANGITIAQPIFQKEVVSYFVNGKDIYKIRYWLSEMEYNYSQASFSDGEKIFFVDKYLRIGSSVYQCTTGRSTKIRNSEKITKFEKETVYDNEGGILAFGKPYLTLVPNQNTKEQLMANVEENNKRRKPAPKPLFPVPEIKFHWKDISDLELYNPSTWNKRNLDIHQ